MSSYRSLSHWTSQQTNILISAAGNAKNIFETITIIISSRVSHSQSKYSSTRIIIHSLFFPPSPLTLFHFLGNFLTSWTLPFLGHFLFLWDLISLLFLWGPFSFILLQFVGLHPTVTTRLISGRACLGVSTIKSAALMFPPPRVNLLVPVPAATYNTCSAHN